MQISKINIVEHVNYNKSANNTITPHMQVQTTAKQITEISNYSYGKDLINKKVYHLEQTQMMSTKLQ